MCDYCSNCGTNITGNNYCPQCGEKNEGNIPTVFTSDPVTGETSKIPDKIIYNDDGSETHLHGHSSTVYINGKPIYTTLGTQ